MCSFAIVSVPEYGLKSLWKSKYPNGGPCRNAPKMPIWNFLSAGQQGAKQKPNQGRVSDPEWVALSATLPVHDVLQKRQPRDPEEHGGRRVEVGGQGSLSCSRSVPIHLSEMLCLSDLQKKTWCCVKKSSRGPHRWHSHFSSFPINRVFLKHRPARLISRYNCRKFGEIAKTNGVVKTFWESKGAFFDWQVQGRKERNSRFWI